jgi:hypothetical protein
MKIEFIPQPKKVDLQQVTQYSSGIDWTFESGAFSTGFSKHTAPFMLKTKNIKGQIELDSSMSGTDAYKIEFSADNWLLTAKNEKAAFYGLMTAKQLLHQQQMPSAGSIIDYADFEQRIIQIDLKCVGWNVDYWLSLPRYFAEIKINCVLLEIEDKFPFKKHPAIAQEPFTLAQWHEWVELCKLYYIEIIPLIQCLGHWEYILKLPEYASLRELSDQLSQGCPSNPATFKLFTDMAEEILAIFPDSQLVCVGGDETRLLGRCKQCSEVMEQKDKAYIYATYMRQVFAWVKKRGYNVAAWGDMFLSHSKVLTDYITDPPILFDWDYEVKNNYSDSVLLRTLGLRPTTFDDWEKMSSDEQEHWRPFLQPDEQRRTFCALPGANFLQAQGCEVIAAACVKNPASIKVHAYWSKQRGAKGLLTTYWAASNSLAQPYTLYEMRKPNIAIAAAISWQYDAEISSSEEWLECLDKTLGYKYQTELSSTINHIQPEVKITATPKIDNLMIKDCVALPDLLYKKFLLEQQFEDFKQSVLNTPLGDDACWQTVDFGKLANDRLHHSESTPGFSRQLGNDLTVFPVGENTTMGVPFKVKPPTADEESIIIVAGNDNDNFPAAVKQIPIETEVFSLHLTHLWMDGDQGNKNIGYYRLHYADASFVDVPIVINKNCSGWWNVHNTTESVIAWQGENEWCPNVGATLFSFKPKSGYITHIDIVATTEASIALLAITILPQTATINVSDKISDKINELANEFALLKAGLEKVYLNYLSARSSKELVAIGCEPYLYQLQMLQSII